MICITDKGHLLHKAAIDGAVIWLWDSYCKGENVELATFDNVDEAEEIIKNLKHFPNAQVLEISGEYADYFEGLSESRLSYLMAEYGGEREELSPLQIWVADHYDKGLPLPKPAASGKKRQATYANRQRALGRKQVALWLSESEAASVRLHLDTLRYDSRMSQAIAWMRANWREGSSWYHLTEQAAADFGVSLPELQQLWTAAND